MRGSSCLCARRSQAAQDSSSSPCQVEADDDAELDATHCTRKDGQPVVTVTIPILNAEKFLAEAIECVIAQTYPSWELLLVEDGSTDGSPEIAKRYARDWPGKIRYLEHPGHENRGMTESRNLGQRNSRGRYIARLDADDVLGPTTFEDQVRILEAHPDAALVYRPVQMWNTLDGGPGHCRRDSKIHERRSSQYHHPPAGRHAGLPQQRARTKRSACSSDARRSSRWEAIRTRPAFSTRTKP